MCSAGQWCDANGGIVGNDQHQRTSALVARAAAKLKGPIEPFGPACPVWNLVLLARIDRELTQPQRKLPERDRIRLRQLNQCRGERVATEGILVNRGAA